jgi:hypothetical protein
LTFSQAENNLILERLFLFVSSGKAGRGEGKMFKDFLIRSCFLVLLVFSNYCAADSIVVDGKTYTDVYVMEGPLTYYVCIPADGTIMNVDKAELKKGDLAISEDRAQRLALKEQFDKSRAPIKAEIERKSERARQAEASRAMAQEEARAKAQAEAAQEEARARAQADASRAIAQEEARAKAQAEAEERASPKHAEAQQPLRDEVSAIAPQAELGINEGFRGIPWGSDLNKIPGMVCVFPGDERGSFYRRANESLSIGGAKIASIYYFTYKGCFSSVMIDTAKGEVNGDALKEALKARYGPPINEDVFLDRCMWSCVPSCENGVDVYYGYEIFEQCGRCMIFRSGFMAEMNVDKLNKAYRGAVKDF